jgi:hypothetical protein
MHLPPNDLTVSCLFKHLMSFQGSASNTLLEAWNSEQRRLMDRPMMHSPIKIKALALRDARAAAPVRHG